MSCIRVLAFAYACATTMAAADARAAGNGTNKTFIRNTTTQAVFVGVDDGGRGLKSEMKVMEGTRAYRLDPNVTVCADETNFFDCPTLRVFTPEGRCLFTKELKYVPVFGDTNKWRWTGSDLSPD